VVSGSARTALSLLGFHCGIREVVIPDLSWTYEHCFPAVHAVPLTAGLGLDADAMIRAVGERIAVDPAWPEYGAVVLNNPHNATGRVFADTQVRRLLEWLLQHGVRVIDDLSYENVAPVADLPSIPTLRDHVTELTTLGRVRAGQGELLITVQSVSKTDCLAGARLSVVEIHEPVLRERFRDVIGTVTPNVGALLLGYLFYRNSLEVTRAFWRLRNTIFDERMQALSTALANLPAERNPYGISIVPPTGSMYPLMVIRDLPAGLSLEWLASSLAR
jgi:aspartate/methionine/tyrosine aminotransferase